MDFSLGYLFNRFFFRFSDFFHHWYVDGSRWFAHFFITSMEKLDSFFGVRINWKFIFQPLYGDYTIIGRMMGFFFRSLRIILGAAVYVLWAAVFAAIYLFWLAIPFTFLFLAYKNRHAIR